jgi:hypothetical protein
MALKPHRILGFLMIVALMTSVCLYPSIGANSFADKALRGATVQLGSELHMTLNPHDFVAADQLGQSLGAQVKSLQAVLKERLQGFKHRDVVSTEYIFEALLPGFFFPGYGLSGVPLYLIDDPQTYLRTVYFEEKLGVGGRFSDIVRGLKEDKVAVSTPVAEFWNLETGEPVLLGADVQKRPVLVPSAGVVGLLPGMPPRTITDRQSYVAARMDYLNYLYSTDAYLIATMDNPKIQSVKVLIPRIFLLVRLRPGANGEALTKSIATTLRARPVEVRELNRELKRVGGDMFIFLALENMRIYLIGGVMLALIAIGAIASTSYLEDRRTLGLLRVRGVSPALLFGFFASSLVSPALIGLLVGVLVAMGGGYGLTNVIWNLRELKSVVHLLPTQLVISKLTVWICLGLLVAILCIALAFSLWVFRRTARDTMRER